MEDAIIKVKDLSKRYRLGIRTKSSDTLTGRLLDIIKAPVNNFKQLRSMSSFKGNEENVHWALRHIDFEVKQGEVLGIIGHNGAGKSTLLKILSRITPPSEGEIEITGRVSSLLEVGTGFHPELTGRDNIFMNGTIHGMTRREIASKLDEIIEFSGVEKYIDTPVKFYSSGMKVRLGFAVAAHLEPEILIIDEVLAVGDAKFQKKCLGKMKDVSESGRTVLFVSHDMNSIQNLCTRAILLNSGAIRFEGPTLDVVNHYNETIREAPNVLGNAIFRISSFHLNDILLGESPGVRCGEEFKIAAVIESDKGFKSPHLKITIRDLNGVPITVLSNIYSGFDFSDIDSPIINMECMVNKTPFAPGTYKADIEFRNNMKVEFRVTDALFFEILDADFYNSGKLMKNKAKGVMLETNWQFSTISK